MNPPPKAFQAGVFTTNTTCKCWLGMQPAELLTYAGRVYLVWKNKGFTHNALLGIWPTDEESQPFYKGYDRGHKGFTNIYNFFNKPHKLLKKFNAEFELKQACVQSSEGASARTKRSINNSSGNIPPTPQIK
eukprot:12507156-Ditylum_brightwellii.AAC.1